MDMSEDDIEVLEEEVQEDEEDVQEDDVGDDADEELDENYRDDDHGPVSRLIATDSQAAESMRERMRREAAKVLVDSIVGAENAQRRIYIVGIGSRGSSTGGQRRYADNQVALISPVDIEMMTIKWMETTADKSFRQPPAFALLDGARDRLVMQTLCSMLDTMSLKHLSLACRAMFLSTRSFVHGRLVDHPLVSDPIHLTPAQRAAYELAVTKRQNIYIAGKAGAGKSICFFAIAEGLKRVYSPQDVVLAAPTGSAAEVCGGMTLAALFGQMTNGKQYEDPANRYPHKPYEGGCVDLLIRMKALLVDEISMVSQQDFDLMSGRLKVLKKSPLPFGGIQVICSGDFAQLPPVATVKPVEKYPRLYNRCLLSGEWPKLFGNYYDVDNQRTVLLPSTIRQNGSSESQLRAVLEELRNFTVGDATRQLLTSRSWETLTQSLPRTFARDNLVLASDNNFVNNLNNKRLELLVKRECKENHTYKAYWENGNSGGCKWPENVAMETKIAVGARVSLTRNALAYRLNNGSSGTVVSFVAPSDRVTWQRMVESQSLAFKPTADNPALLLLSNQNIGIDVRDGMVTVPDEVKSGARFPVVRFDRQPNTLYVVTHWTTPIRKPGSSPEAPPLAVYVHVPLRIAYAATFHRCQGMTLVDNVSLNLANCFTPEQVYVAISRVRSIAQIVITDPIDVRRLYSSFQPCEAVMRLMQMFSIRERNLGVAASRSNMQRRMIEAGKYEVNLGRWAKVTKRTMKPGSFAASVIAIEKLKKRRLEEKKRNEDRENRRREEERLKKEEEKRRKEEEKKREEERQQKELYERLTAARNELKEKRRVRDNAKKVVEKDLLDVMGGGGGEEGEDQDMGDVESMVKGEKRKAQDNTLASPAKAVNLTCSICMETQVNHTLSCGHLYCKECVDLLSTRHDSTCPQCRAVIVRNRIVRLYF